MKAKFTAYLFFVMLLITCKPRQELASYGTHYQKHNDYQSLQKVVDLLPLGTDTTTLKELLGEAIDMGFDYRYLLDSTGTNGCVVGAVFHLDEAGKVDQKWLGEICE